MGKKQQLTNMATKFFTISFVKIFRIIALIWGSSYISGLCWMTHLNLLPLCVQHVGVDAQRSQHAHHQLLLPQPRAQLTGRRGKVAQSVDAGLQLGLPLGCSLVGRLPAGVWEDQLRTYRKIRNRRHGLWFERGSGWRGFRGSPLSTLLYLNGSLMISCLIFLS